MSQRDDLLNKVFGKLRVVGEAEPSASGRRRVHCVCECGAERVVIASNLKRGHTTSCGCSHFNDLTGQHIGKLTVLERSDKYGSRGKRKTQLWKCRCDCGAITYKATDTLTNPDVSMCQDCATNYALNKARENAGFVGGTQVTKIQPTSEESNNASGVRGVYLDPKTGKYRARIKFQGKLYNLGSYTNLPDAVKARRQGEEEYFGKFLNSLE